MYNVVYEFKQLPKWLHIPSTMEFLCQLNVFFSRPLDVFQFISNNDLQKKILQDKN